MSTDHWMPLYIGDYLADTGHLSACEHGAYLLLLMHYWRNGPLPDNDKQLAAIARTDRKVWATEVGPVVREFFVAKDGKLHQKRCEAERAKAGDVSAKRRAAAESRWKGNQTPPDRPNGPAQPDAIASANAPPKAPANGPTSASQMHTQPQLQVREERKDISKSPSSLGTLRAREADNPPTNPPDPPPRSDFDRDLDRLRDAEPTPPATQTAAQNLLGKVTRALSSTVINPPGKRAQRTPIEQQREVIYGPPDLEECDDEGTSYRRGPVDPVRSVDDQLAWLHAEMAREATQKAASGAQP